MSNLPDSRPRGALHHIGEGGSWLVVVLLFGPASLVAEALIERTHHRPLGAATFASLLILLWVMVEIFTKHQLGTTLSAGRSRARKYAWVVGGLLSVIVLCRGFL